MANTDVGALKSYQRINHFPGMGEICRKDNLSRNFKMMRRVRPAEYNFSPQSWLLPAEYTAFKHTAAEAQ